MDFRRGVDQVARKLELRKIPGRDLQFPLLLDLRAYSTPSEATPNFEIGSDSDKFHMYSQQVKMIYQAFRQIYS